MTDETGRKGVGERQPEREAAVDAQAPDAQAGSDDELETPTSPFTPIAPFGDAKPWAGSTLDAGDDELSGGEADLGDTPRDNTMSEPPCTSRPS